jgi:hypothetical protein
MLSIDCLISMRIQTVEATSFEGARRSVMNNVVKVKIGAYGTCCFVYSLLFSGLHWEGLYVVLAIAYGAITVAEFGH